jgi:hypothetical protein
MPNDSLAVVLKCRFFFDGGGIQYEAELTRPLHSQPPIRVDAAAVQKRCKGSKTTKSPIKAHTSIGPGASRNFLQVPLLQEIAAGIGGAPCASRRIML